MQHRVGIISDVHANEKALRGVLEVLRSLGVTDVVCLGDLVGYGHQPSACLEAVRDLKIPAVQGNHDAAVAGAVPLDLFPPGARASLQWTIERLTAQERKYLAELPRTLSFSWGELVHASPLDPLWHAVSTIVDAYQVLRVSPASVYFVGHTHRAGAFSARLPQVVRHDPRALDAPIFDSSKADPRSHVQGSLVFQPTTGERYIVNPGSVGQPRDGDPRASFAILVVNDGLAESITWYLCGYDLSQTQAAVMRNGLPRTF